MRILVLEDTEERVEALRSWLPGSTIKHAVDVGAFIDAATWPGARWDVLILDHDLGEGAGTGLEAVALLPDRNPCLHIVWSVNPVRAPHMVQDLQRKGCKVYRWAFDMSLEHAFKALPQHIKEDPDA